MLWSQKQKREAEARKRAQWYAEARERKTEASAEASAANGDYDPLREFKGAYDPLSIILQEAQGIRILRRF